MRIAIVAPPWLAVPPVGYGGTEAIIDCLARGFHEAGHDVLLFTVPESTCPVPRKSALPHADRTRLNWTEVELRHLIHAYEAVQGFDIVHDHTMLGPIYSERFPDLRVVTTQHHPYDLHFRDIFRASAHRVPIVAISRSQAALAPGLRIERIIHHGIDPRRFEYNGDPDDYFLFLGRMAPTKGVHRAVQVARAAGIRLKIAARMADTEGERDYFHESVEPFLDDRIEYVGEVSGQDKQDLIAHARALLNPIRWPEPFGLAMVESLACGTPVLAFAEGAAPEIVQEGTTGFLCRDEDDMVKKLKRIDAIDRRMCRRSVEDYFCSERMVREYVEYFEELIQRDEADDVLQPGASLMSGIDLRTIRTPAVEAAIESATIEEELTSMGLSPDVGETTS